MSQLTKAKFCLSRNISQKMLENSVLLLNFDQSPLNIISLRRALDLMSKNKVYFELDGNNNLKIKAISGEIIIPRILILKYYVKVPNKKSFPSKKNILRRDKYICQYCNITLEDNATIDHIVPRYRGGSNSWVNMVACCRDCNLSKGNRTPKEAGMVLRNKPKEPSRNLIFEEAIQFFLRIK
jgi:5-methylcytosine-specific restriction endonuclease McrA